MPTTVEEAGEDTGASILTLEARRLERKEKGYGEFVDDAIFPYKNRKMKLAGVFSFYFLFFV